MEFKFHGPYIKFYWNRDPSVCLQAVNSYFHVTITELSSWDSYCVSSKSLKYLLPGLLQEKLVDHRCIVRPLRREKEKLGSRAHILTPTEKKGSSSCETGGKGDRTVQM